MVCLKAAYLLANVYIFSQDLLLIWKKLSVFPIALRQCIEKIFFLFLQVAVIDLGTILHKRMNQQMA